jgi:hypothetical protein
VRRLVLATALLALALAGCGGDDTKTVTRTVTAPSPPTTEAPTDTSTNDFPPPPTDTTPTDTNEEPPPTTTEETPSSGTPSQEDAQSAARTAANDYTRDQYGISGDPGDWTAICTGEGDVFSCAVTFNGGQCNGRLTLTGPDLEPGSRRIGCGD